MSIIVVLIITDYTHNRLMKYTLTAIILLWGLLFTNYADGQGWQWAKANTKGSVDGWSVATDRVGNVFVGGVRTGNYNPVFDGVELPGHGVYATDYQCLVAKYDNNGHFQWVRGTEDGSASLIGIASDPAGNVFMFGYFSTPSIRLGAVTLTNAYDLDAQYFIAKYDPLGNLLWAKKDGNTQRYFTLIGSIGLILGTGGIAADDAGNVYISANFHKPAITIGTYTLTNSDPSGNTDDIFIAKYDPTGNVEWAKSVGGTRNDDAYALTVTPAGDIYIAGDFNSPSVSFGTSVITDAVAAQVAFIARFDASGTPLWATASGGTGLEYACGLAADASGNVYLTGGFKDNSIAFSGTSLSLPFPGKPALYLVKFDPANNISWFKTIGSPTGGDAYGYAVATSVCGDVWVCGAMSVPKTDSVSSNPGIVDIDGHLLQAPDNSYDPVFIAGYTASGTYVASSALASGDDDQCGVACDAVGNVFLCSDYFGKAHFSVGSHSFPQDTSIDEMMYVAKFASRPPQNFKHLDTVVCYAPGLSVSAPGGYTQYLWSDGKTGTAVRTVTDTGTLWVWGYDSCSAMFTDTFRVSTLCDCRKYFFVPNSFTPNGDGQNDVFYPRCGLAQTRINTFRIYNRWGALVFERENIMANDVANAWDGTYQGSLPLPDVYVYVIEAVCETGAVINKKGSVTVIR